MSNKTFLLPPPERVKPFRSAVSDRRHASEARVEEEKERSRRTLEAKEKDVEIKRLEAETAKSGEAVARLNSDEKIRLRSLDVEQKRKSELQAEQRSESNPLSNVITTLLDEKAGQPSRIASLGALAQYATPDSPHKKPILAALTVTVASIHSVAEVGLIFQLFDSIGPDALAACLRF